jgi:para-aminobenzoate synthetase/4-amino-4-deoxychorismate lyase
MAEPQPFVLLDDARAEGASDAHLFENPREVFVARRPEEVLQVLEAGDAARVRTGGTLAGYLAYEAGLALEPKLAPLATERSGAGGPLVWFGLFDAATIIPAAEVPQWLAQRAGGGPATMGPLEPQLSTGGYLDAFATLQEAIRAGDIYQAT